MLELSESLLAYQKKLTRNALVRIDLHPPVWTGSYELLTNHSSGKRCVLRLELTEKEWAYHGHMVCQNADGWFTDKDFRGWRADIYVGYSTVPMTGGHSDEWFPDGILNPEAYALVQKASMKVIGQYEYSAPGVLQTIFYLAGDLTLMESDYLSWDTQQPSAADALSGGILAMDDWAPIEYADDTTDWDGAVGDTIVPMGTSRLELFKNAVLSYDTVRARFRGDEFLHSVCHFFNLSDATTFEAEFDLRGMYAYSHPFLSHGHSKSIVIPNQIVLWCRDDNEEEWGTEWATDSESNALLPKRFFRNIGLRQQYSNHRSTLAREILQDAQVAAQSGRVAIPPHLGLEVYDHTRITDARMGGSIVTPVIYTEYVKEIKLVYYAGRFDMEVGAGLPPASHRLRVWRAALAARGTDKVSSGEQANYQDELLAVIEDQQAQISALTNIVRRIADKLDANEEVEIGQVAEAISAGNLCYLTDAMTWALADNTSSDTSISTLGVALADSEDGTVRILTRGKVAAPDGGTYGQAVYVGLSGEMALEAPSDSGAVVRIVGHIGHDGLLDFNPEHDWVELA